MDNAKDYFDAWLKTQEAFYDGFLENAKKTQQLFLGQSSPVSVGGGVQDLYSSWSKTVLDSVAGKDKDTTKIIRDNLAKMLGGSNAYLKLYDLWLPLMKAAQERLANPDAYKEFVAPAQFKELIDKVFGFDSDAIKLALDQAVKVLELSSGSTQQFSQPWADAAKTSLSAFPRFAEGHPESFITLFHSLFNAFDGTIGRAFHVPPVGKDREKIELLLRGFDDLSVYASKNIVYQHTIYSTGLTAVEKVIEKLAEILVAGQEIKQFDEFFDIWIDASEQAYFELFQTEEFSRIQGELLDSGLNARTHFFKIMEMQLYDLPVVLRTEIDDLYKTVYELGKKVKKLEKQLKEEEA
ncbi:Poly(3-hydroxyalkanoate) polymerase subunit PhaE [Methylococcales bacterium]|nr:Poly(3-hydroxyalkanoate) polymerase subunit PhaE [Methylococcales bacterium]